eukprot:Hpha_TRINITY_DN12007_c0_g1::TRINITY_DN12007_c0_g1_i1::g.140887::m.140887
MVWYYCPGWYWDFTIMGDAMRNFNTREFMEGYHSHGMLRHGEDFQGKYMIQTKPTFTRAWRYFLPFLGMYFGCWFLYWHRMYSQNSRCPWGGAFDPSKEYCG